MHAFLRLDCLVQALGVAPALHDAAGELVDDLDLAVDDHVLLVAMEHVLRLERLLQVVDQLTGRIGVDVIDLERGLDLAQTGLGGGDGVLRLVHLVVDVGDKTADGAREVLVRASGLRSRAGDDERGPGLVDEDGVDLVDDGIVVAALHAQLRASHHVVAQVVEAELRVGSVGDVRLVCRHLEVDAHAVLKQSDIETEEVIDETHPLGVPLCQVVVDRDDVHALARDGVEIGSERRHERLTLAGLHLGDRTTMERYAADELDVEVAHPECADRSLANGSERLGEELVEHLLAGGLGITRAGDCVVVALSEQSGLASQLVIIHGLEGWLQVIDAGDGALVFLDLLVRSD